MAPIAEAGTGLGSSFESTWSHPSGSIAPSRWSTACGPMGTTSARSSSPTCFGPGRCRAAGRGARAHPHLQGRIRRGSEVAHPDRESVGDAFVALSERLLEADAYPRIATHDPEMIRRVGRFAHSRGIAKDRLEFQMLYGIRRDIQRRLVARGYRVRVPGKPALRPAG